MNVNKNSLIVDWSDNVIGEASVTNQPEVVWCLLKYSKPALLEGLEVDQYIWGIVQSLPNAPYDEVTIDTAAKWKPVLPLGVANDQQDLGLSASWVSW